MHGVFPGRPGALAAIRAKIRFCASREVIFPSGLEVGPRLVEARRVAGAGPAAVVHRIEADVPPPLRSRDWQSRLDRNRTDLNVTVENVPAVRALGVRAAGEGGHAPLKCVARRAANYQSLGDREGDQLQRVVGVEMQLRRLKRKRPPTEAA
jgi:hypothetical protein